MKKRFIISMFALGVAFTSCKKLVELSPQNQVPASEALKDVNGYQALITSVYDRLQSYGYYGRDLQLMGDALADNITVNAANGTRYQTNNTNTRNSHYNIWSNAYGGINELNIIISSIDGLNVVSDADKLAKQQIKAQAYALRGMIYFDLARVYGYEPNTIPASGTNSGFDKSAVIRLTPTLVNTDADLRKRSTVTETYAAIETDLNAAITAFKATTTMAGYAKPTVPYRFSESATHALLGKVYLYERKYAPAVTEFDNALSASLLPGSARMATAGQYVTAFKTIPNPESLLELSFNQAIEIGQGGINDALYTYTQPTGYGNAGTSTLQTFASCTASAELVASFESGDDRRAMFFNSRSATVSAVLTWCSKYSSAGGAYTDNVPLIRYSDVVLMKAEALAAQLQYADAAALIRTLRINRNATAFGVPNDNSIVPYIQAERRRELFFEGHRWFDLKRLGQGVTKPAAVGTGTLSAVDYRILAPIPTAEVALNANLPQNPNY
ncbi:RagB/SusD family nutrient uptake outer membrane protein [Mucilaginibacter koreensis]